MDAISQAIQARLKGSNESRSFAVQPITSIMTFDTKKRVDTKATDEEEGKREESSDEDASDDDEVMDAKSRETSTSSAFTQPVELDLSQKPLPPSRKYQPSLVCCTMAEDRVMLRYLTQMNFVTSRLHSGWCEQITVPTQSTSIFSWTPSERHSQILHKKIWIAQTSLVTEKT